MLRNIWTPLADGQPVQHKEPGQLIYLQDTRAECFYYIVSGTVKCYISSPEGEERILTLPHAGELIGEAAFFDRQPRVSSAVAVTPCQLVEVDRQRLTEVFARHPLTGALGPVAIAFDYRRRDIWGGARWQVVPLEGTVGTTA